MFPQLIFILLLILPAAIYQLRLMCANVKYVRADVNVGYELNMLHFLGGLNLSLKEHLLVSYSIYSVAFSAVIYFFPSISIIFDVQIINILILLCFVWLLFQPLPESFDVASRIVIGKDERVDFNKRKYDFRKYTKMYESSIFIKFQKYADFARGDLYKGFSTFVEKKDIISYLDFKSKTYLSDLQKLNEARWFETNKFYVCDLRSNKILVFFLFMLILSTNYTTIFAGSFFHALSFKGMNADLVSPWYFLLTTFATVGYGDVVPSHENEMWVSVCFLIQVILFLFVIVNVINDQSTMAMDKYNRPHKDLIDRK